MLYILINKCRYEYKYAYIYIYISICVYILLYIYMHVTVTSLTCVHMHIFSINLSIIIIIQLILSNSCLKAVIGVRPLILRVELLSVFVFMRSGHLLNDNVLLNSSRDHDWKECKCLNDSTILKLLPTCNVPGMLLLLSEALPTPEQNVKTPNMWIPTWSEVLTEVEVPLTVQVHEPPLTVLVHEPQYQSNKKKPTEPKSWQHAVYCVLHTIYYILYTLYTRYFIY